MPLPVARFAVCLLSAATASALTVVPSALHLYDNGPGAFPGRYTLLIYQDAAQTDFTGTWFSYDTTSRQLTWNNANIDESSDWYFVSAGQNFSFGGIDSGDYVPFDFASATHNQPYGDFYLGGTTGLGFTPDPLGGNAQPNRTVLGWGHFQASASGITLIDSAVAYDASSITVGTLSATPIPEPASAVAFAGVATLVLAQSVGRRRRAV